MRAEIALKVLAISLATLLAAPYIAVAAQPTTTTTSQGVRGNVDALAAKLYIKRVELFINITLKIAEAKNITIPSNLTNNIDSAKSLISQAREELSSGNINKSVNLATQAAEEFTPVAIYVWTHISASERRNLEEQGLIHVIEARISSLNRLKDYINKLNESGVNVKPLVMILDQVNKTLHNALEKAKSGDLKTARILLAKADHMLMVEFRVALHNINVKLHQVAACAAALRGLGRALLVAEYKLNSTINLIQENKTSEAEAQLNGVEYRLKGLSTALDRIYNKTKDKYPNSTITQVIGIILNATLEAKDYINQSIQSLEANDTNSSIVYITLAIQALNDALEQVNETGLPKILHHRMAMLGREAGKTREAIMHGRARMYSAMAVQVDKVRIHLEHLLQEYNNGTISRQTLIRAFTHGYIMLVRMKHALGPHAPDWLVKKIDDTLQWIKNSVPEAGQGAPGMPGGHQGNPGSGRKHGGHSRP